MEVVSTSNLVYSETKKAITCNFKTMPINSCPHDLMKGQIGSYGYMQI